MTFTVTPAGIVSKPMAKLVELVAALDSFRGGFLAGDGTPFTVDEALERVCFPYADDRADIGVPRPRAIVTQEPGFKASREGTGYWVHNGVLGLAFEWLPEPDTGISAASATAPGDNLLRFMNLLGDMLSEIKAKSAQAGPDDGTSYLNVIDIDDSLCQPLESDPSESGGAYFYGVQYLIRWRG